MQTLLSIVKITTNDVSVGVKIDFKTKQVSLVEQDGVSKKWLFTNRVLEYKKGWHDILEAMKVAMDYGFEQLEKAKKEDDKIKDKMIKKVLKENPNFGKMSWEI